MFRPLRNGREFVEEEDTFPLRLWYRFHDPNIIFIRLRFFELFCENIKLNRKLISKWKEVKSKLFKRDLLFCLLLRLFFKIFLVFFKVSIEIIFSTELNRLNNYFIICSEMIEFLSWCNPVVLLYMIDWLFLCPENIPFLGIFSTWISSIFEGLLDTDSNLSFVLDVSPFLIRKSYGFLPNSS